MHYTTPHYIELNYTTLHYTTLRSYFYFIFKKFLESVMNNTPNSNMFVSNLGDSM
jgi:hypothetical protein